MKIRRDEEKSNRKKEMTKYIAPEVISVNRRLSPCECTDTVVCAYCVQANLMLWEKEEKSTKEEATLGTFNKMQRGKLAQLLGVNRSTVSRWLKSKRIPPKCMEKFEKKVLQGDITLHASQKMQQNLGLSY